MTDVSHGTEKLVGHLVIVDPDGVVTDIPMREGSSFEFLPVVDGTKMKIS